MLIALLRLTAFLLLLTPAVAENDAAAIRAQHDKEIAACDRKLDAEQFKRRIEFQACLGRANAKIWARTPHWDLFLTADARDFALAEQFDKGGMTEAQYRAARARIRSDLLTEVAQRDAYRAIAQPPPYRPPPPQGPIHCYTTGRTTTCY